MITPVITVGTFRPFKNREEVVISLRFDWDYHTVNVLKAAIRAARQSAARNPVGALSLTPKTAGGWLPPYKAWFVEPWAWPLVREWLNTYLIPYDREPELVSQSELVPSAHNL